MNAAIAWTFPVIASSSKAATFLVFAGMMTVQFFVANFFYPETRKSTSGGNAEKAGDSFRRKNATAGTTPEL